MCCSRATAAYAVAAATASSTHSLLASMLQARASPFTTRRPAANTAVLPRSRHVRSVNVRAEVSYVMVKPDGVQRGLVGEVITRFERKGFKIVGLKLFEPPKSLVGEHYKDLSSKPFYPALVSYITSGPVVCLALEGTGVVASARKIIGATNPLASEPGTIRGDFGLQTGRNIVHGSDSPENGERETALWFKEGVISWSQTLDPWLKE